MTPLRPSRRLTATAALALAASALSPATAWAHTDAGGGTTPTGCATVSSTPLVSGSAYRPSTRSLTVANGQTVTVTKTTRLKALTIASGGTLTTAAGYTLTLTVNGVETGQVVNKTGGTTSVFPSGSWHGNLVLTVAEANDVTFGGLTFTLRQALYVGANGVDADRSVASAYTGRVSDDAAAQVRIASTGELFNGIYVTDHDYTVKDATITLTGNGRSDFIGQGAAVVGSGAATRLVLDGARISNKGVVRTGVIAEDGANVLVKNSRIATADGTLPADYQSSVNTTYMQDAPWMLGISGNSRATNVLGVNTKATYLNSAISSQNWGALSVDSGQNAKLNAINSVVCNTGRDGYGSYAIGGATENFLGTAFHVKTYATIMTGGTVTYGDSTRSAVSALNSAEALALTSGEIASVRRRATTIDSARFGVMWHDSGTVNVTGHTQISTKETTFLDKGQQINLNVDGSDGASIRSGNGVVLQVMENDDPGPVPPNMLNTGVYTEPTTTPTKDAGFDVTSAHTTDATSTFTDADLTGSFFNAMRTGKNMVLTFDGSVVKGQISSATAKHRVSTISSANYRELGEVTNTPAAAVNNGTIVDLTGGSVWTVTGTSYLTKLTVGNDATIQGTHGKRVQMTVDGVKTSITPGATYTGTIKLTVG